MKTTLESLSDLGDAAASVFKAVLEYVSSKLRVAVEKIDTRLDPHRFIGVQTETLCPSCGFPVWTNRAGEAWCENSLCAWDGNDDE